MVSAMSRPIRVISEPKADGIPVLLPQAEAEALAQSMDGENADVVPEETATSATRKQRGSGKKVDRNAGLALVPDLNFMPSGKDTLRQFVAKKNPDSDLTAVLVVLYYMQHLMALSKIGPSHIMTALKDVGKAIPVDLKQTIRNAKSSKMWVNFSDLEDLRTTTQGDNYVEHEMGKVE